MHIANEKFYREIILVAKNWYPDAGSSPDTLRDLMSVRSTIDGKYISDWQIHDYLIDLIYDCKLFHPWWVQFHHSHFLIRGGEIVFRPKEFTLRELIDKYMTVLALSSVDDIPFELGDPNPEYIKGMKILQRNRMDVMLGCF